MLCTRLAVTWSWEGPYTPYTACGTCRSVAFLAEYVYTPSSMASHFLLSNTCVVHGYWKSCAKIYPILVLVASDLDVKAIFSPLTFTVFIIQVLYDATLHTLLDSYLRYAPRWDTTGCHCWDIIGREIFAVKNIHGCTVQCISERICRLNFLQYKSDHEYYSQVFMSTKIFYLQ